MTLRVNPRGVLRTLLLCTALLIACSLAGQGSRFLLDRDHVYGLVPLFDINWERSVPTLFSTALLLAAAALLGLVRATEQDAGRRPFWAALAWGFGLMAADEFLGLHERLAVVGRWLGEDRAGVFHFAWVVPALMLLPVLALAFSRFWWHLPRETRTGMAVSAATFVAGAVGMEMLDGLYAQRAGYAVGYALLTTIEEGCEMIGVSLFIYHLLQYIRRAGSVEVVWP